MIKQLIVAGAWLLMSLFFLFVNLKISRRSKGTKVSFYGIWISAGVALYFLTKVTMEYANA